MRNPEGERGGKKGKLDVGKRWVMKKKDEEVGEEEKMRKWVKRQRTKKKKEKWTGKENWNWNWN